MRTPIASAMITVIILLTTITGLVAQSQPLFSDEQVKTRVRVIIDNDFGGDPDGLVQLAHHILSPSVDIRGIIASRQYDGGFYDSPGTAAFSYEKMTSLLNVMNLKNVYPTYEGSEDILMNRETPASSDAAKAIVKEAMRDDTDLPLYIACGAGLTNIASAWLMEPKIAERIILVWIGGPEYPDLALPPPNYTTMEYNLGIDHTAAQVIFNVSDIPIWQVPRDAYRQTLVSYAELLYRVQPKGVLGEFLTDEFSNLKKTAGGVLGEAYAMGDNPLVLLTALQSTWNDDPSSSIYVVKQAPIINDNGMYEVNHDGRRIRIYTDLDVRLMMEDFYAKLGLYFRNQ